MIWAGLQALSLSSKIAICTTLCAALFSACLYVGHKWGVAACYEATIEAQRHTIETGIKQAVRVVMAVLGFLHLQQDRHGLHIN